MVTESLQFPETLWVALFRVFLALIVGTVIGLERGKQGRAAGMRTHILVTLGATVASMTGMYSFQVLGVGDPLRISAQVISGIGFLGVGTILLKGRFQITGLTTAAGLWCTAAIGLAIGIGYYEGAAVAFLASIIAVTLMHSLEYKLFGKARRFGIYVEIKSDAAVTKTVTALKEQWRVTDVQITAPRSATQGNVGIEAIVYSSKKNAVTPEEISVKIAELDDVVFALESV